MSFPKENETQSMIKEFGDFIRYTDYKDGDISDKIKTLALNIPLNSIYEGKISPLILTIYYNYCNVFNILLSRGFDINASDDMFNNMNPLMWAIEKNNEYMIERLLSFEHLDLFFRNKYNENILFFMGINMTNISLFKRIIDMMIEKDKEKFMYYLCSNKNKECDKYDQTKSPIHCCFQYLNQYDDRINDKNYHTKLTLQKIKMYLNSIFNYNKELVKYYNEIMYDFLISKEYYGINSIYPYFSFCLYEYLKEILINRKITAGISWCVYHNNIYLLHQFLHDGYDINTYSEGCGTALTLAILRNNYNMVKYLIDLGANKFIYFQNYDELNIAIENDNLEMVKLLEKYDYSLTYEYSNSIDKLDLPEYYRPLHVAVLCDSINCAKYIVDKTGDDISFRGNCSKSPLSLGLEKDKNLNYLDILKSNKLDYKKFHKNYGKKHTECCICLDSISSSDIYVSSCGHAFHEHCILTNMKNTNSCPYCRSDLEVDNLYKVRLCDYKFEKQKKVIKRKRTKSLSEIDEQYLIFKDLRIDKLDLDNYHIDDTDYQKIKFQKLREKFEEKDRNRKIEELRKYLYSLKCFKNIRRPKTKTNNTPILKEYKPSLNRELKKLECFYNQNIELKRSDRKNRSQRNTN